MATAVELAVGYFSLIPELRNVGPSIRRGLGEAESEAGRSGQRMGDSMSGGLTKNMMAGVAGLGLAAGALIGKGMSDAMANEITTDKLAAGLGATGDQAASYGAIAGKVYAQAYGENLGEVSTAIDSVASSLKGVGGAALDDGSIERLTKKALDFSTVYGTDVAEQVQLVNQLVGNGLADSADQGFDMLTRSFQKVPAAMRGELPEILSEYGTNFRALGFEGEEAFNLLIGAAGQGKFVLDKTGDALKEFTIRGSDMSKASSDAYAAIGLSAEEMSKAVAGGGDGAQVALQKTAEGLLGIEDPATRANTAIALFGTPLEDLSVDQIPAFLSSLAGAPDAMGDVAGAADQMGATLADNAGTRIEGFKRSIMTGLTNLVGGGILPVLGGVFSSIATVASPALEEVKGGITAFVTAFREGGDDITSSGFAGFLEGLGLTANAIFTEVKGGVEAFVAAFVDGGDDITSSGFAGFLEGLGVTARNLYDTWQSTIFPALQDVGAIILDVGQVVIPILWDAFSSIIGVAGDVAGAIGDLIGFFVEHKDVLGVVAGVITATLLPTLVTLGISLAGQAAAWTLATIQMTAYNIIGTTLAAATKVWAAGQWLLNAALNANPIGIVIGLIALLVGGIILAYKNSETFRNIVQAAWEGIQTAISFAWESIIKPVFEALKTALGAVGDFFSWVWNSVIKPAWSALSDGIAWYWQNVIMVAFDALKAALGAIGDFFGWVWNSVIKPVWDALGNGIAWVWDNVIRPAFDALKSGLQGVGDFFGQIVDAIQVTWDRIKDIVRKPIEFMVNTIYNSGIVPAWNSIAGFIGLDDKKLSPIEGFKTGGVYPGYTPGRDTGVIAVGGGEAIMRPEWTRAVGPGYVDAANSAARSGGVGGVKKFLGAFADGGIVDSMKRVVDAKFPGMQLTSGLRFTDSGYHSKGMAADFSDGGDAGTPTMKALAGFIADNYAPDTIELIHSPFDRNIGGGGFVGDGMGFYGAGTMSEHRNHVHWAVGHELGEPSGGSIMSAITGALGGAVNWVRNKVADLFEKPVRALGEKIPDFGGAPWAQTGRGIYDRMADASIAFVRGKADEKDQASSPASSFVAGAGAEQWRGMMIQAYQKQGYEPLPAKIDAWVKQIDTESGGDPNIAQQIVDVNGTGEAAGVGLGQMIPTTWQAYRDPSLPDNRRDPWAMTNAMVRYGEQRYGASLLDVIGRGHGYDQGGIFKHNTVGWNTSGKPEAVLTNDQWMLFEAFNKTLAEVGPQFITKMSEIVPKAGMEILGLDGTLLDPESNRYLKAGQEIAKTAQDFQSKRASEMAEVVQPVVNNDYSVNLVNPVFQDQNQALRDANQMQNRQMMRNAGRPY
ncbi:hypothetical protein CH298_02635 [Rhodococcoides fascians]|uniref:hypothetical protein n=1 Tax=Rhodococcoides fascians TaxID=1828 RepID=UPI000B9C671A|nr:hypothetical protein [Rhodococcus fascians]OZE92449.1 hypothetical protein CH303_02635 [Rhodococcus fascians]OZF23082.1 hypothetical protein CH298_02635 [Rhodococcus fascians]OZF24796.1 hypothetical protein CH297_02635 [Rhodococcus fascians]OZF72391.1 hypothetical protein CH308_02640 [Rhodococcus fascians]OZF73689.1 hypothetical protein CH307_02635 [Rhodococcus fascians]